jgi:hypothetical protein
MPIGVARIDRPHRAPAGHAGPRLGRVVAAVSRVDQLLLVALTVETLAVASFAVGVGTIVAVLGAVALLVGWQGRLRDLVMTRLCLLALARQMPTIPQQMATSLPASSRGSRDTRPRTAVPRRMSGRSRSPRNDPSTITSPASRAAHPDKPGRPRNDPGTYHPTTTHPQLDRGPDSDKQEFAAIRRGEPSPG